MQVKKAAYKSSNSTVTLTPSVSLPRSQTYKLTVNGTSATTSLIDINGNLLDGNKDGITGGNYISHLGSTARSSVTAHAFDALTVQGRLPRIRSLARTH